MIEATMIEEIILRTYLGVSCYVIGYLMGLIFVRWWRGRR